LKEFTHKEFPNMSLLLCKNECYPLCQNLKNNYTNFLSRKKLILSGINNNN